VGHGVSDANGGMWSEICGCMAWGACMCNRVGVMRSEWVGCMMCVMGGGEVQVSAARGAWGCRKVPCVVHNGVRRCCVKKVNV
jgi:hypothetical protein